MPKHAYDEVLALFRNGAVVEAAEKFNALHENALARQLTAVLPASANAREISAVSLVRQSTVRRPIIDRFGPPRG